MQGVLDHQASFLYLLNYIDRITVNDYILIMTVVNNDHHSIITVIIIVMNMTWCLA